MSILFLKKINFYRKNNIFNILEKRGQKWYNVDNIKKEGKILENNLILKKMPKFFVQEKQVNKGIITVEGKDVNHIKNVLRKKEKDEIEICIMPENKEEKGKDTISEILEIKEESIKCKIKEYEEKDVEGNIEVTIFQGLPKSDKMELVIQKSTELGVHQIYPVEMKRCVVKLKGKDEEKKVARWQKISEVAAKQCGRSIIPQIKEITTIESICRNIQDFNKIIVAYEE